MASHNRLSRQQREQEKSDMLYLIYKFMGVERTLKKLHDMTFSLGLKVSEKTLVRYSAKYQWQRRLLEENAVEKQKAEKAASAKVEQMNTRHAQIAQSMMAMVVASVTKYQESMRQAQAQRRLQDPNAPLTLDLTIDELTKLYKTAQQGERMARGQATSRIEVWVDVTRTVVHEFGLIFLSVYQIEDKDQMKAEFIRLSDEMLTRYFNETTKSQLSENGYHQLPSGS